MLGFNFSECWVSFFFSQWKGGSFRHSIFHISEFRKIGLFFEKEGEMCSDGGQWAAVVLVRRAGTGNAELTVWVRGPARPLPTRFQHIGGCADVPLIISLAVQEYKFILTYLEGKLSPACQRVYCISAVVLGLACDWSKIKGRFPVVSAANTYRILIG